MPAKSAHGDDTGRRAMHPDRGGAERSNSPIVENESGEDVDVEEWDPMPENLQRADALDETELSDPMEGPAPTG
jgi:hypothetical protein